MFNVLLTNTVFVLFVVFVIFVMLYLAPIFSSSSLILEWKIRYTISIV